MCIALAGRSAREARIDQGIEFAIIALLPQTNFDTTGCSFLAHRDPFEARGNID
jgi:hypothetical protein